MVRQPPSPHIRGYLRIHLSAACTVVAASLFLGRSWLLHTGGARHTAYGKSDSAFHSFQCSPTFGDGVASAMVESRRLCPRGNQGSHVGAGGFFFIGGLSAG